MKELMAILDFLIAHWTQALTGALIAVSVAAVCCMPQRRPQSLDEWWTWLRDSLQTAVPASRATAHPTLPADPAQPKK